MRLYRLRDNLASGMDAVTHGTRQALAIVPQQVYQPGNIVNRINLLAGELPRRDQSSVIDRCMAQRKTVFTPLSSV